MLLRFLYLRNVEPLGLPSATVSASGFLSALSANAAFLAALGDSGTFALGLLLVLFPFIVASERGRAIGEVGSFAPPGEGPGVFPDGVALSMIIPELVEASGNPLNGTNGGKTEEGIEAKLASDPINGGWINKIGFSGSSSSRIDLITSVIKLQNCNPCFISVCIFFATRALKVSALSCSSSFWNVLSESFALSDVSLCVCLKDRARCRFIRCIVDVAF
mmetsp:Transcript_41803/g.87757  ORF Transcript_41803/g.87757 Transcript_41803/m.87757 type:complete len:219 (+) Transcript_41803:1353-2009(+)